MKVFISHSSKNKFYGSKLVDLLRSVGVKESEIIFTSNTAYGIPVGQNIFHWLKTQINEKPFVIYLLSEEYYQSIACLNEMGAAWIIENKHAAVFTPNFNLSSKEFQNGALDPREIGFYINDEERVLSFLQLLSEDFEISKSHIIISQSIKRFMADILGYKVEETKPYVNRVEVSYEKPSIGEKNDGSTVAHTVKLISVNQGDLFSKLTDAVLANKLKDDELILLHYVIETGRFKLMAGWQEHVEVGNIKEWEVINEIDVKLSRNYSLVLKRFELRGYTEISALTSSNNPKEFKIKEEISAHLFALPENVLNVIMESVKRNHFKYTDEPKPDFLF